MVGWYDELKQTWKEADMACFKVLEHVRKTTNDLRLSALCVEI
jgi:hypothetical protein